MKIAVNTVFLALSLAFGSALAADAPAPTAATPSAIVADTNRVEAEVVGIDKKSRTVTLKGPEGNLFDVTVGKEAKNFPQIKVGDRVIAEYAEALALKLKKGGGLRETTEKTDMQTAKSGQKPGALKTREINFVADVMEVDTKASTMTILGAKGRVVKLKIKDPAVLAEIKKGDQVEGSYIQATGIIVVPSAAK